MPEIEFKGISDSVHFDKSDFTRHDIEDQGAVTFTKDKRVQEVSQGAFDYLNDKHNGGQDFGAPEPDEADGEQVSDEAPEGTGGTGGSAGDATSAPAPAEKVAKAVKKTT